MIAPPQKKVVLAIAMQNEIASYLVRKHKRQINKHTKTMKTTLKTTLAALSLAILVAFTFASCKSTSTNGGMHNMGGPKPAYPMSNESMARTR
ncbi:hypothetical protein BH11VER1_BH11VER1_38830 [soil metagenome]